MTAPAGVAAAVAVGIGQGLDVRDPIVLHERHGLIVHLRPSAVVARVTRTGSVCRGPREWDIAGLVHRNRVIGSGRDHAPVALHSYGEYDEDGVDALMPALTAWIGAWATYADSLDGRPLNPWTVARLEWLRDRSS